MVRITNYLHEYQYIYLIIYLSKIFITRKVADESCRENQNTIVYWVAYLQSLSQGYGKIGCMKIKRVRKHV
jgi:hypothetical protein